MTTIKLTGGGLGSEKMFVRCDLSRAESPIQVDYDSRDKKGFVPTQYQCADARHRVKELIVIAKRLAASAVEMPESEFDCEAVEV